VRARVRSIPTAIGLLLVTVGALAVWSQVADRQHPVVVPVLPSPIQIRTRPSAPVTSGIHVPGSIDATGESDVSDALSSFIANVPDGSTIVFKDGATYRLDHGLRLTDRHGLTFEGNGATLKATGCLSKASPFELADRNDAITIRDFILLGSNRGGGTSTAFQPGCEYQAGVAIYDSTNIDVGNVRIADVSGDCLYVDAGGSEYLWSEHVSFHDSACEANGRMGVAILGARHVMIERVAFDRVALGVLDIEPYLATGGATDIMFRDSTVGTYALSPQPTAYFFAADGEHGSIISDVTVTRNVLTGGALSTDVTVARRADIVVTDNISAVETGGPVMTFQYVDGLTVTGNIQPLRPGPDLVQIRDSTSVTSQ
jgi:hypothetical protein